MHLFANDTHAPVSCSVCGEIEGTRHCRARRWHWHCNLADTQLLHFLLLMFCTVWSIFYLGALHVHVLSHTHTYAASSCSSSYLTFSRSNCNLLVECNCSLWCGKFLLGAWIWISMHFVSFSWSFRKLVGFKAFSVENESVKQLFDFRWLYNNTQHVYSCGHQNRDKKTKKAIVNIKIRSSGVWQLTLISLSFRYIYLPVFN